MHCCVVRRGEVIFIVRVDKEKTTDKGKSKENSEEPPAKKARNDFTTEFVSLEKALSTKWSKLDRRTLQSQQCCS